LPTVRGRLALRMLECKFWTLPVSSSVFMSSTEDGDGIIWQSLESAHVSYRISGGLVRSG
jgi:hypothetical protein